MDVSGSGPAISVAIGAYNAERWISETLDSIMAQTRPAAEVIVVDDASTDGTARVLEPYGNRIRVLSNRVNSGLPATLNYAFSEATGDYVALCGADDLFEPRKLEWQAEALAAHPEIDLAFGHARVFGVLEGEFARPRDSGVLSKDKLARALYERNLFASPSVLIRRTLHEELGGFREDLPTEDWDFWLRALEAGAVFYFDPRIVLHVRRHGENMSMPGAVRNERLRPLLEMNYKIHQWHADLVSEADARRALAKDLCDLGRHLVEVGTPDEARRALKASFRKDATARALIWLALLPLAPARRDQIVDGISAAQRVVYGAVGRLRGSESA
jgi:glycosyltransferase involved in cell wall biosynthesis